MKHFKCCSVSPVFAVIFLELFSTVMPNESGHEEHSSTPASASSSNTGDAYTADYEAEPVLPEDPEMQKGIDEYTYLFCIILVGECWLNMKRTKSYISEDQRLQVCYKNTKGFYVCDFLTEADAQKGKDEAEQREMEKEGDTEEKKQQAAERREKLMKRMDALNDRSSMDKETKANVVNRTTTLSTLATESSEVEITTMPPEFAEAEQEAEDGFQSVR